MNIRPTQASTSAQVRSGLLYNLSKLVHAQQQVASGKRILKPSDDPLGAGLAQAFRHTLERSERYRGAIQSGRTMLDTAASQLLDATGLLSEARALLLQGMNGTLDSTDRATIAGEVQLIRERLIDIANTQSGDRYLFAGTATGGAPYSEQLVGGRKLVAYGGNDGIQELVVGRDARVQTTIPGTRIFSDRQYAGMTFSGLTGLASGTSANQGSGSLTLDLRHDATSGALGAGLAFAGGGANDTLLGDHQLVVDAALGTVQLGAGPALPIPQPGDPDLADFTVTSAGGAELHLDFSGFAGVDVNTTVRGDGSISIDGSNYAPLTFSETDLRLVDQASGRILHVDTTAVERAGPELVQFGGTVDVFDVLQGIADDLENTPGLATAELQDRLGMWLSELDRNYDNVLRATGTLGSRSERISSLEADLLDSDVQVHGLLSGVEDADFSQVVLDMTRAEQTLELAQATSVRLLSSSLLNFLR